jgi:hypothetical protein
VKERHSSENSVESKPGNVQEMREGKKKRGGGRSKDETKHIVGLFKDARN